ncbi:MAG: hypothetical protein R6V75_01625 [Bacteroidales bacterium]
MCFRRSSYNILTSWPILVLLLAAGLSACNFSGRRSGELPLAKAFNRYLYPSDVLGLIPQGTTPEDSTVLVRSYIDLWLKRQAVLNRAEFNLPEDKKNLQKLIEEYRTSLLIYEYEKLMVAQNLDTIITNAQIRKYYLDNSENLPLQHPIIKGVFIRVPASSTKLREFRQNIRASGDLSYTSLFSLSAEYAESIESYEENWTNFTLLMQKIPGNLDNPERFLTKYRYLEAEDDAYTYFVKIYDFKLPGEVPPLEYIEHEIRDMLLNRRKIEFLRELEESIFNHAVMQNQVEVYENR